MVSLNSFVDLIITCLIPKAPEVLDTGSRRQTTYADVYALGMVSYLDTDSRRIPTNSSLIDAFGMFTHGCRQAVCIDIDVQQEIFTGRIPYAEKNDMAVWGAVVVRKEIPPRPQLYQTFKAHEIDDDVWKLLVSCWAYDSDTRPTALHVKNEVCIESFDQRLTDTLALKLVKIDQGINGGVASRMLSCS